MFVLAYIAGRKLSAFIRKDSNRPEKVARIIDPVSRIPQMVMRELANKPNHFVCTETGFEYELRNGSFVQSFA